MTIRIPFLRSLLTIGLCGATPPATLAQNLGEWRTLTAEEDQARIGDVPGGEADPAMIEADFDGDRTKDKALIAVRTSDGARGLVVVLKNQRHVLVLSGGDRTGTDADKSPLLEAGLRIAKPGSWQPNCFDDECFRKPPRPMVLKNPGILLYDDGSTVLYAWDAKAQRFTGSLMVH